MSPRQFMILNFAYGYGPFLRTVELALAINQQLEQRGQEKFGIIVPWVYGEEQKRIMREQFPLLLDNSTTSLILDSTLGKLLRQLFFEGDHYGEFLKKYVTDYQSVTRQVHHYLSQQVKGETLDGENVTLPGASITVEVSRAPRLCFDRRRSYYTTFGHISEILEKAREENVAGIESQALQQAIDIHQEVEKQYQLHFIADPATFSHHYNRVAKYETEIFTPPSSALPPQNEYDTVEHGMYVTVTGIPGLEHLLREAQKLGLKIYTNKKNLLPGAVQASPNIIFHNNIKLHFARSGWGSIWLSMFSHTPFVTPPFSVSDDPEIYFNNQSIEALGLGKIYRGQPLVELLQWQDEYNKNIQAVRKTLQEKYGTEDGVKLTAKKIVDHLSSNFSL